MSLLTSTRRRDQGLFSQFFLVMAEEFAMVFVQAAALTSKRHTTHCSSLISVVWP